LENIMLIKFVKPDPRAGTVARMDSGRGQQLIDARSAVRVQEGATSQSLAPREDGPTVQEFVAAGYPASDYPPEGYASKSTADEIAAAMAAAGQNPSQPTAQAPKRQPRAPRKADAPQQPAAPGSAIEGGIAATETTGPAAGPIAAIGDKPADGAAPSEESGANQPNQG
jgi:hypothetical protein